MIKTYTTAEVAELAHCHIKTVQRWIREQRLPARKIGRRWLVTEQDLQRFLEVEPPSPVLLE